MIRKREFYRGDRKLEWGTLKIKNLVPQEELERAIETQENSINYQTCTAWKAVIHSYFLRYSWFSGHFFDFWEFVIWVTSGKWSPLRVHWLSGELRPRICRSEGCSAMGLETSYKQIAFLLYFYDSALKPLCVFGVLGVRKKTGKTCLSRFRILTEALQHHYLTWVAWKAVILKRSWCY